MAESRTSKPRGEDGPDRWRRRLGRLGIQLRHGEAWPTALLFLLFFLFVTFNYATKTVRQATFIDALGAAKLPYVYLMVALISYPLLRAYSWVADRLRRHQVIAGTCLTIAASQVLFWWLYQHPWTWVPFVFYIWVSIVFVMLVSQFWSLANHVFDPRQAKRLFGVVGAGGLLGGVAGGQVARFATNLVGSRSALLIAAAILVAAAALIYAIQRVSPIDEARVAGAGGLPERLDLSGGLSDVLRSRQLTLIAAVMVLGVIVAQIVDMQFSWAVETATTDLDQRMVFFGNLYSIMGVSALVFQLAFTSRIHRTLGLGFALRVLPSTMALGTVVLFLAAGLFPGALIFAALVLKVGENGLRYSLDQATRELLFLPVASRLRLKAKAFIDVFLQRGAKGLGALLLLPVTFGIMTVVQAGWISLVLIAVWLVVTVAAYREYVRSFRDGLRKRTLDARLPLSLTDLTTLESVIESLGSSDRRQVLRALELLSVHGKGHLVSPMLLHHDDALVRRKTLRVLAETGRRDAMPLVAQRLGDADPRVQAEAIRVLAEFRHEDICTLMRPRLRDSSPGVRAAAVASLTNNGDGEMALEAAVTLRDMLSEDDPLIRLEVARALGTIHGPRFESQLLQLLYDDDPRVIREAIRAVHERVKRDGFNPVYAPTLISLLRGRRLRYEAREALVAFGEPVVPALVHFLRDAGESILIRRALPGTIARIDTPAASDALFETLDGATDTRLRKELIDALGRLRSSDPSPRNVQRIEAAARFEARRFSSSYVALHALGPRDGLRFDGPLPRWDRNASEPRLLEQMLVERMEDHLDRLFGLLALLHEPPHVRAAHRSLLSEEAALRSHSLEYLDNTLAGAVRRDVFVLIDEATSAEKVRRMCRLFGITHESRLATMRGMLDASGDDQDVAHLAVATLYTIYTERIDELYPRVGALARGAADPFVQETAGWVARRLKIPVPPEVGGTRPHLPLEP